MRLLPVIDLRDGQAVRAVAGERERYRPVYSRLSPDADPLSVGVSLFDLAPFGAIYVADLDAIMLAGSRRNLETLQALGTALARRGLRELWLDAGRAAWTGELAAHLAAKGMVLRRVVGSESLAEGEQPQDLAGAGVDWVLSLDHRAGEFIGPPALAHAARTWPRQVLAMELAGVGMRRGPPLQLLAALSDRATAAGRADIELFAGGGVRDADDLTRLETMGVTGALVATALHDGRLDAAALRPFFGKAAV